MSRRLSEQIDPDAATPGRSPVRAVVALGANLGDRSATMAAAIDELGRLPLSALVAAAAPIESIAVTADGPDASAPTYLNSVALLDTTLAPAVLLELLHAIEERHGRERRVHWGDRTLDLDLIAYGDARSDDPRLRLPHPRAAERDFVLEPWLSLDADAVLPGAGRVADLLALLRARPEGAS